MVANMHRVVFVMGLVVISIAVIARPGSTAPIEVVWDQSMDYVTWAKSHKFNIGDQLRMFLNQIYIYIYLVKFWACL